MSAKVTSLRAPDELTTRVVNLVRAGQATTRRELMRVTGLGRTAVEDRVDQAILAGILADDEYAGSTGGRPSRRLRFRGDRGRIHAVDIGGAHISMAITDLSSRVLGRRTVASDLRIGPEATLTVVRDSLASLAAELGDPRDPWAVVVGFPGPVDADRRRSLTSALDMPGWLEFDIPGWFAGYTAVPVWVENDLNLLARQVWEHSPQDADHSDMFLVKVSNGIGMAMLSGGRVHRGRFGRAGGIGHSVVVTGENAAPCICGQTGCLETVAAGWGLVRDATEAARDGQTRALSARLAEAGRLTVQDVIEGAREFDPVSVALLQRSASKLGEALANFATGFDPGIVYLCGVLPDVGDYYQATVRRALLQRSFQASATSVKVLHHPIAADEGVSAAAGLALQELFRADDSALWFERATTAAPTSAA
ncbi:ROK family protein [Amycolatopsis acidicola]|uniref:ROK family protein n=1 Tax=Amycolatopsis acidicola TaxID=2596893 RepID=A0A5N0V4G7_9PSEU|nr:ROK family protein [Amycolatopsis acidicola]KAA9160684.1 ROK family protein [Amycolatopsis acidicola]